MRILTKFLIGISATIVLATGANASSFCNAAENMFLKGGLEKEFLKLNKAPYAEHCKTNIASPLCEGEMKAAEIIANNLFNKIGFDSVISLLNKEGIKQQYTKSQLFLNYANFFADYLKNKLQKMNEKDRKIFLEKLYLFFTRVPDRVIRENPFFISDDFRVFKRLKIIKQEPKKINNIKVAKTLLPYMYLEAYNKVDIQSLTEGLADTAYSPQLNLQYKIFKKKEGFTNKDPQLGSGADNLQKFFVYAATKQWDKAYNLIDKTYSNEFVNKFNESMRFICKETKK